MIKIDRCLVNEADILLAGDLKFTFYRSLVITAHQQGKLLRLSHHRARSVLLLRGGIYATTTYSIKRLLKTLTQALDKPSPPVV